MVFKIPSTNEIDNLNFEISVHVNLRLGILSVFYILIYDSNPRIENDINPVDKVSFATFRNSKNINIRTYTEYYIQYIPDSFKRYGNSIILNLIKNKPLEFKNDNLYTITTLTQGFLPICYFNMESIKEKTKIYFHVSITKEFNFNYTFNHLNYEEINLNEKDYDDFLENFVNYAVNLYEQPSENIFLGKGLYYNEMFYSVTKEKGNNMLLFAENLGIPELTQFIPIVTNMKIINMNQIKSNFNNKYTKTNGSSLYFYIDT